MGNISENLDRKLKSAQREAAGGRNTDAQSLWKAFDAVTVAIADIEAQGAKPKPAE